MGWETVLSLYLYKEVALATEHRLIPDAERHEPKGASTASAGYVLKANGDGSTDFVDPLTLENIEVVSTISNFNSANINPSSTDVAVVAGFSSTVSNSDITIDSSGLMTVATTGLYNIAFNLTFGRSNSTGTAITLARLLINDVQFGFTQSIVQAATSNTRPVRIDLLLELTAGDQLKVEIMRDSAGVNDGGLLAQAVTLGTWGDVPSYFVRASRIQGAA